MITSAPSACRTACCWALVLLSSCGQSHGGWKLSDLTAAFGYSPLLRPPHLVCSSGETQFISNAPYVTSPPAESNRAALIHLYITTLSLSVVQNGSARLGSARPGPVLVPGTAYFITTQGALQPANSSLPSEDMRETPPSGLRSTEQLMITGLPGHNVTLECRAPTGAAVRAAEWSRPDLEPEYIFFYRNKQSDATNQHPSFAGRAELLDGQLKGGELSIVLQNLRRSDSGTYKCRVKQGAAVRSRRAVIRSEPICSIQLTVSESSQEAAGLNAAGENLVGRVGLLAGALLLVVGGI